MGLRALTLASSAVRRDSRLTLLSRPIIPGTMHTSIHMRWASVFDSCHTVLIGWGAQLLAATQARLMRLDSLSFQTQHSLFSVSILLEYMYPSLPYVFEIKTPPLTLSNPTRTRTARYPRGAIVTIHLTQTYTNSLRLRQFASMVHGRSRLSLFAPSMQRCDSGGVQDSTPRGGEELRAAPSPAATSAPGSLSTHPRRCP